MKLNNPLLGFKHPPNLTATAQESAERAPKPNTKLKQKETGTNARLFL